ncbi:MAG: RecB-like helicase [Sulfurospirillum sp.]
MIKNLALEASAGSGKTFALSVRYISLLILGSPPSEILTLTFTNKAALEMKRRIFDTLKNLETADELVEIIKITSKSKDEILSLKPKVLREFLRSDLKISTIDSFFSSILRKFSFNIGLMPDFKLEETLLSDDLIERFLKICKSGLLYKSLILFSLNEKKKLADIFSLFALLFEKHSEIDFENFAKQNREYPNEKEILVLVSDIKQKFQNRGLPKNALKTFEVQSVKELLEKKFLQREDLAYWTYKKYVNCELNDLHNELKDRLSRYVKAKEGYVINQLSKQYIAFCGAMDIDSKQNSTLSFSQMTNRLFDILRDDINRDFLYFRLDGSFKHLLIDEFQDTNIVQYKILEPFMQEIVSGVGVSEDRTLFLVGDTKQSIYRFRGGAKELFSYAATSLNLEIGVLGVNYRSSSSVVDFINKTFSDKISGYRNQEIKKEANTGYVAVVIDDDIEKNLISNLQNLLSLGILQSDIAVLCYTNKEALMLKELIEDKIYGAKASLEAKRKLIEVPVISGIIDFVFYLYFKDELYLENFCVKCGKSYKEDEHLFDLGASVDTLVARIIRYFNLFDGRDDVLLFIESCAGFRDVEEFLFNYQNISQNSLNSESEGIRVLTIHKSKGLEFSNVFVVDRLKRARSGAGTFIFDYDDIQLQNIYLKVKNREYFDDEYKKAKVKEGIKEYEDALNTQYVAFTRAKNNLFILSKEKSSAFSNLDLCELQKGEVYVQNEKKSKDRADISCFKPNRYGIQEVAKAELSKVKTDDFMAVEFGLALHYMLEMLGGFEPRYIGNAYESLRNRYKGVLDESDLEDIKKRVLKLLKNSEFRKIIQGAKLSKEQPVYYRQERKQLDLLLEFSDKVVVVDYKSSELLQSSHVKQVGLYKKALKEIYAKECEAYLCYLKRDDIKLVKV